MAGESADGIEELMDCRAFLEPLFGFISFLRKFWHGMCMMKLNSVHPQVVDFGSWQGSSVFATAGIVRLFRGLQKSENAARGRKMPFVDGH
jgi:hypothetical protein